ncbi:MAG: hypothetical protein WCI81_08300 [Chlorobiaceae bacterium]
MLTVLMAGLFLTGHRASAEEFQPAGEPPPARTAGTFYDHPCHRAPSDKDGRQWQKNSLGLSDSQKTKVHELRQNFIEKDRNEFKELFRLSHELVNESIKQSPNAKDVADLGKKIGKVHEKLASLRSNYMHDLSTILSREQMHKFIGMEEDFRDNRWLRHHHHYRDDGQGKNCKPSVN